MSIRSFVSMVIFQSVIPVFKTLCILSTKRISSSVIDRQCTLLIVYCVLLYFSFESSRLTGHLIVFTCLNESFLVISKGFYPRLFWGFNLLVPILVHRLQLSVQVF